MATQDLYTIWGENLDKEKILQEYPRPQLMRDSYLNLNGEWDYCINNEKTIPNDYYGKILVPFAPECLLSGVDDTLLPNEFLHYRKLVEFPKNFNKGRVLLNFGAVDMFCDVFVNGNFVGHNDGGYFPFSFDITQFIIDGENQIQVTVWDLTDTSYHSRGKQQFLRGGIWYTPSSGIWQTVWCESVPQHYIKNIKITPYYDSHSIKIELDTVGSLNEPKAIVTFNGEHVVTKNIVNNVAEIEIPNMQSWSPENPNLYDLDVVSANDNIKSYFGMRKFSVGVDEFGVKRLMLNNKPYFFNGLLDQGYWSDGMYTAPSDQALIYDIVEMKKLGFNMLRKHIKIEPLRWYYHCDKLGMIVWQDMLSGGQGQNHFVTLYAPFINIKIKDNKYKLFGRDDIAGRNEYRTELKRLVDTLFNVVSIAEWTPFNEGWGQFDAKEIGDWLAEYDNTRLIDHASGWHDQGGRDFRSMHIYFKSVPKVKDERPIVLSEFGGYSCKIDGHCFNLEKNFGYKKFKSKEDLQKAVIKLYEKEIIPKIADGLCATVYTQVSDVEDEINGILTYDRKVNKFDTELLQEMNKKLVL